jgi:outer membrane immunogenic protein
MKHLSALGAIGGIAMSAGIAAAADLPVRSPPPAFVAAPVFTWTGCYAGLHAGYGGGRLHWEDDDSPVDAEGRTNNNQKGGFAGAQIGCNYQFNSYLVVGVQGDIAASDLRSKLFRTVEDPLEPENFHTKTRWFGSVTGRLGYAVDRFLVYGKGGVAFAQLQHRFEKFSPGEVSTFSGRSNRTGWTAGVGVEYAFNNSWSGFAEYNYMHFGQKGFSGTLTDGGGTETENYRSRLNVHALKVGVNYKFW